MTSNNMTARLTSRVLWQRTLHFPISLVCEGSELAKSINNRRLGKRLGGGLPPRQDFSLVAESDSHILQRTRRISVADKDLKVVHNEFNEKINNPMEGFTARVLFVSFNPYLWQRMTVSRATQFPPFVIGSVIKRP